MLPLWVSCCERILRVETHDYSTRAWCRLEALLAHAFQFADHQVSIPANFHLRPDDDGMGAAVPIENPSSGHTTDEADAARIGQLAALAYRHLGPEFPNRAVVYRFGTRD